MRSLALALVLGSCGSAPADVVDAGSTGYDVAMPSWTTLFDGTLTPTWRMSTIVDQPNDDPGHFALIDGALEAQPGNDIGLLWYTEPAPANFELALQWRQAAADDNSGVFVRFPDLESKGYNNTAFVAAHFGFEVQIDNTGHPDGADVHTTGAIYEAAGQQFTRVPPRPIGEWNDYLIHVVDQTYTVSLNGTQTTVFTNTDAARGAPSPAYVGIQTHTGNIAFRAIRIRAL